MALAEYRIGALEYEFVNGEEREIAIHIPSDADMSPQSIQKSLTELYVFRDRYFDQWKDVKLTCDTWMLMPELGLFLREDSHILAFQKLFAIDSVDREATWYMGWIFPGCQQIVDTLPERTSLQRGLKKFLLEGRTFGIARGHILQQAGKAPLLSRVC